MRVSRINSLALLLGAATVVPAGMLVPTGAAAQAPAERISQPAMPMADALVRIRNATGAAIEFDPDAVRGVMAAAVSNAADAEAAVRQAVRDRSLSILVENDTIMVTGDIVVRARRDEAETSLLVRQATTSTRTGQSLRDQPRNSQVISDRLIREQQSLTVVDALRNAGGVSVNNTAIGGGATYSVRGFAAGGAVNGLPSSTGLAGGVAAGATQPVANIERIEVLKGPDAILIGSANDGGLINIVVKKPSVEPRLSLEAQTGSFGLRRFVLDAGNALTGDRKLSARVIASASDSDRGFGGSTGDRDFLFAPSLRFKDGKTDIVLNASISEQFFGSTPVAVFNPATSTFFDVPRDRPLLGVADQGTQIDTSQFYGEVTHQPTTWLTLVGRTQHQKLKLQQRQYAPLGLASFISPSSVFITGSNILQDAVTNAVDGYARFDVATGPISHKLTVGYTYANTDTDYFDTQVALDPPFYDILDPGPPLGPLPRQANRLNLQQELSQSGYYAQYLVRFWKLSLLAGVRRNNTDARANNLIFQDQSRERVGATVPNFGAVLDVTDDIALFGTVAFGYRPTPQLDRNGQQLPDTRTRNIEGGVKIDLFDDRALINASWFELRESNLILQDFDAPPNPATGQFPFISVPGQRGRGIDVNIAGRLARGWEINASFTRTNYRPLTPNEFLTVVVGQPRDQYNLYTSYRRPVGSVTLGGAAGLYGRSSAPADSVGEVFSPAARQFDLNGFLEYGALSLNLNVRNVFDRVNYGTSFARTIFPISEPRMWRLSATYRFK